MLGDCVSGGGMTLLRSNKNLKQCRKCGEKEKLLVTKHFDMRGYYVHCNECGTCSYGRTLKSAKSAWNKGLDKETIRTNILQGME
jgi:ribosomal protein L37E